jgi:malonate decarboxylase epsilon subunit
MSIALLCPGQGAQEPGFLHMLPEHPVVVRVLAEASEFMGRDVLELDTATALSSTVPVQLALLVAAVAFAHFLDAEGVELEAAAGMSVGAFGAAVAAGALPFTSALRFVERRAQLMQESMPAGWGMAVVEGLREGAVQGLLHGTGATIANYNSPVQFVIAGQSCDLAEVVRRSEKAGAYAAKLLNTATASHTRALAPAAQVLEEFARGLAIHDARIPVYSNRTARPHTRASAIREDLVWNMAEPVRWYDVKTSLEERGITLFVEAPPGHTLTRLVTETSSDVQALAAGELRWDLVLRECRR